MRHLWKHEVEAIAYDIDQRDVLLHLGLGCGKTRIGLEVTRFMLTGGRF